MVHIKSLSGQTFESNFWLKKAVWLLCKLKNPHMDSRLRWNDRQLIRTIEFCCVDGVFYGFDSLNSIPFFHFFCDCFRNEVFPFLVF